MESVAGLLLKPIRVILGLHWGYVGVLENKIETAIWSLDEHFSGEAGAEALLP